MKTLLASVASAAVACAIGGCTATVQPRPVTAYTYADASEYPPDTVLQGPSVIYEGRPTYYYEGRWYFRDNDRWGYYRQEPPQLYQQRQRQYVQQAPPAHVYSTPAYGPTYQPQPRVDYDRRDNNDQRNRDDERNREDQRNHDQRVNEQRNEAQPRPVYPQQQAPLPAPMPAERVR